MDNFDNPLKMNYSMIDKERLVYDDMESDALRAKLVDEVRRFNNFFISLCDDIHVTDRFLVDLKSLNLFKELVNKDLKHHLVNGWNLLTKIKKTRMVVTPLKTPCSFIPLLAVFVIIL